MRDRISGFVDHVTVNHRRERQDAEYQKKKQRQQSRRDLTIHDLGKKGHEVESRWPEPKKSSESEPYQCPKRTATGPVVRALWFRQTFRQHFTSKIFKQEEGRIIARTEVGQILFDAAMLYEAMSTYRDKSLIQKYLHHQSPLHPRRTLDQAYYWTLKTTKTRDRDQVVYRGTRAAPTDVHKIDETSRKWNCKASSDDNPAKPRPETQKDNAQSIEEAKGFTIRDWKRDQEEKKLDERIKEFGARCADCRAHIRKVSRVIMVDQLWMWILDERTILTSFPKRYGLNREDYSGVHKAIKMRLKGLRSDHIRTVFDLALIILDECSNVFFDRTKTQVCTSHLKSPISVANS